MILTASQLNAIKSLSLDMALRSAGSGEVSEREVLDIYTTSVTIFACVNLRADNVGAVPFQVVDKDGKPRTNHPLNPVYAKSGNYRSIAERTEMFMSLIGHSVIIPNPNILGQFTPFTENLIALNPRLYIVDADAYRGFRGIRLSYTREYDLKRYYTPDEMMYLHGRHPTNDFDGLAPSEVAAAAAGSQSELFNTQLQYFTNKMINTVFLQPSVDQPPGIAKQGILRDTAESLMKMVNRLGIGSRNAGRTMVRAERWEALNINGDFADLEMDELTQATRQAVCEAFGIPVELITFQSSNFAQSKEAVAFWRESWLQPRVWWYAQQQSAFWSQWYGEEVIIQPDLSQVLAENQEAKVALAERKLNNLSIDLYTAALESGVKEPHPALKDMYRVGDLIIPVEEIKNVWRHKLLIAPSVFNSELITGEPLPQPVDPNQVVPTANGGQPVADPAAQPGMGVPLIADDSTKDVGTSLFVALSLRNNVDLIALQQRLKQLPALAGVENITWNTPADFHVTVLYAPLVEDPAVVQAFVNDLQALTSSDLDLEELRLQVGSLAVFDNLGEKALHFRTRKNAALKEYQQQVFDLAQKHGIAVSSHSDPGSFKPHITMAYVPQKISETYETPLKVTPDSVYVCHGDTEVWRSSKDEAVESTATKALYVPERVFKELEIAATKARKSQSFTPNLIAPSTADYIRTLVGLGIAQPEVVIAAKAHYLSVSAAKAYNSIEDAFKREFADELDVARHGEVTKRRYINILTKMFDRFSGLLWDAGLEDGGVDPSEKTAEDEQKRLSMLAAQRRYITEFADTVFTREGDKESGVSEAQAVHKPLQWWTKSMLPIYYAALERAGGDPMMRWRMDPRKENCRTCFALDGQVHRYSDFTKRNFLPSSLALECGKGGNCGCSLEPAPGEKASGRLSAVPYVRGRKGAELDHHHDHEHEHDEHEVTA
jgi:2'-5' RNA ligase/phage portal protein BeeE